MMGAIDLPYKKLNGRMVVLDGHSGRLYLNPSQELLDIYRAQLKAELEQEAELDCLKLLPAQTLGRRHYTSMGEYRADCGCAALFR